MMMIGGDDGDWDEDDDWVDDDDDGDDDEPCCNIPVSFCTGSSTSS